MSSLYAGETGQPSSTPVVDFSRSILPPAPIFPGIRQPAASTLGGSGAVAPATATTTTAAPVQVAQTSHKSPAVVTATGSPVPATSATTLSDVRAVQQAALRKRVTNQQQQQQQQQQPATVGAATSASTDVQTSRLEQGPESNSGQSLRTGFEAFAACLSWPFRKYKEHKQTIEAKKAREEKDREEKERQERAKFERDTKDTIDKLDQQIRRTQQQLNSNETQIRNAAERRDRRTVEQRVKASRQMRAKLARLEAARDRVEMLDSTVQESALVMQMKQHETSAAKFVKQPTEAMMDAEPMQQLMEYRQQQRVLQQASELNDDDGPEDAEMDLDEEVNAVMQQFAKPSSTALLSSTRAMTASIRGHQQGVYAPLAVTQSIAIPRLAEQDKSKPKLSKQESTEKSVGPATATRAKQRKGYTALAADDAPVDGLDQPDRRLTASTDDAPQRTRIVEDDATMDQTPEAVEASDGL